MAKRRQYSDQFRASAVVMLEAAGYPETEGALTRVAQSLKVPLPTLLRWYHQKNNPPPSDLVIRKRLDLKELIRDELHAILGEMTNARPTADYKDLAVAFGIMTEKLQLLEGKPTERLAHELSPDERATRVAQLLDTARARRTGQLAMDTDD